MNQYMEILNIARGQNWLFTNQDIQKHDPPVYINSISARTSEMTKLGYIEVFEKVPQTKEQAHYTIYIATEKGKDYLKKNK